MTSNLLSNKLLTYKVIRDNRGVLIPIEEGKQIPFSIKRVYFIKDLNQEPRGFHAHKKIRQVLVCLAGSCKVLLDDGNEKQNFEVSDNGTAVLIDKEIWHEMYDFSSNCILAVFASDLYLEGDYLRNYEEFKRYIKK